jgi:hypothetical protein
MASDKEQQGIDVRYHARMAQGAKLDGTSLNAKGKNTNPISNHHSKGGLHHVKKK